MFISINYVNIKEFETIFIKLKVYKTDKNIPFK